MYNDIGNTFQVFSVTCIIWTLFKSGYAFFKKTRPPFVPAFSANPVFPAQFREYGPIVQ
jgi:hypothetical protein